MNTRPSITLRRTPHLNNKQNKNTNPIISRQDYHLTQPCSSEEKQTNIQKLSTNLTLWEAHTNHWTNLERESESEVIQSCPTLCDLMNCSTLGLPVHHQLPEFTQTPVHQVGDANLSRAETKRKKEFNLLQGKNSTFLEA